MKRFAVHDSNGKLLRTGSCSDKAFSLQAVNPGEQVIEIPKDVEVVDEQYFEVKEGKLQHSPSKEAAVKAASAASKKADNDRLVARDKLLQDIIDEKGPIEKRLVQLARIVRGDA